jgi:hypothetical protein
MLVKATSSTRVPHLSTSLELWFERDAERCASNGVRTCVYLCVCVVLLLTSRRPRRRFRAVDDPAGQGATRRGRAHCARRRVRPWRRGGSWRSTCFMCNMPSLDARLRSRVFAAVVRAARSEGAEYANVSRDTSTSRASGASYEAHASVGGHHSIHIPWPGRFVTRVAPAASRRMRQPWQESPPRRRGSPAMATGPGCSPAARR